MTYVFPEFDDLPAVPGTPQGCLWGFYDKDGVKDEIGSVNLLTPEVVKEAGREIQTGRHVQLDWPLESIKHPGFARVPLKHRILDNYVTLKDYALDDELEFNTQGGSQWDSLKHYAYQKKQVYYNGLTFEEAKKNASTDMCVQDYCDRGGIVGRGVLVDMLTRSPFLPSQVRYWTKTGQPLPNPWSPYTITVQELESALTSQGTTIHQGDILLVRSGYVKRHNEATDDECKAGTQGANSIGLEPSEETVRWLYKHHLAAVGGDTIGFEALPRDPENVWCLHEWLLVFWGTPIGELWDLERLGEICGDLERWSFFLTSAPLNVRGGVGSPPGAIAVF
ncbi:hypothetical protein PG996_003422 [Apiospora saccharicola]|uniref:Cyclase n=1 Tax=Apiospora saccharicola TaxID=335842 RepID=A0ABR1W178_9PEZI